MATAILPTPTPTTTAPLASRRLDDIPVPSEVTAFLDKVPTAFGDDRREWERQYTLSFLYGGMEVACCETPDGNVEILHAADIDDMAPWLDSLTDEQYRWVTHIRSPRLWAAVLWDAGIRPPRRKWFGLF